MALFLNTRSRCQGIHRRDLDPSFSIFICVCKFCWYCRYFSHYAELIIKNGSQPSRKVGKLISSSWYFFRPSKRSVLSILVLNATEDSTLYGKNEVLEHNEPVFQTVGQLLEINPEKKEGRIYIPDIAGLPIRLNFNKLEKTATWNSNNITSATLTKNYSPPRRTRTAHPKGAYMAETKGIDVLIKGPLFPRLMEKVDEHFRLHKFWLADDREAFLSEVGPRIRGLVTSGGAGMGADRKFIDSLPNLEIIVSNGVGYDPIDIGRAKEKGIIVTNTPKVLNDCVADLGVTLLLAVSRRICEAERYVRDGDWKTKGRFPYATKVGGKVLGIAGFGNIGQGVAKRAEAFGMDVHFYDPAPKDHPGRTRHESLVALASASDFLILTLPGGDATRGIINLEVLKALGPNGYLINIARGSVVNDDDLITALREKLIAGAGLDVFVNEPEVPAPLFEMKNVTLLPHIASNTKETTTAMADLVFDNLYAHFTGKDVLTRVV